MTTNWTPEDLNIIEQRTVGHYDSQAESFWEGTKDHDVTQNRDSFLQACEKRKPLDILDFGCGPGRDVKYFKTLGHAPVGLDGSEAFCRFARTYT
ncbi:MAG: SAM-dependent methyltransferase, partial [Verrucomicrobiota bacterium]